MTKTQPDPSPPVRKRSWKWGMYAIICVGFTIWTVQDFSWWGVAGSVSSAFYTVHLFRGGRDIRTWVW